MESDQVKLCVKFFLIHLKLGNITISPEMIEKTIATLDYAKTPGNFVHISKVVYSEF